MTDPGRRHAAPAVTPDGRYLVVQGRLWRASNPSLAPESRQGFVDALMAARRAVRSALAAGDPKALAAARSGVQAAKEALGERGEPWWDDGAADFNRRLVENSPYAQWWLRERATPAPFAPGESKPAIGIGLVEKR